MSDKRKIDQDGDKRMEPKKLKSMRDLNWLLEHRELLESQGIKFDKRTLASGGVSSQTSSTIQNIRQMMQTTTKTENDDVYVEILEQPQQRGLRFRYECESRFGGSVHGENSVPSKKSFPTIKIHNYIGTAVIVVSCVTKDEPYKPHPHNLVGKNCRRGVCTIKVTDSNIISFPHLSIQCAKKKDVEDNLRQRKDINVDPYLSGFSHIPTAGNIDRNVVRLCFQVFIPDEHGKITRIIPPVVSHPIYDKKSLNELVICRTSKTCGTANGGDEIFLLCDKINRDDVQVRFYKIAKDGTLEWEDFGLFSSYDVHRQYAIVFKTPPYKDDKITKPVEVLMQLTYKNSSETSDPVQFVYMPDEPDPGTMIQMKKLKVDHLRSIGLFPDNKEINVSRKDDINESTTSAGTDKIRTSQQIMAQSMAVDSPVSDTLTAGKGKSGRRGQGKRRNNSKGREKGALKIPVRAKEPRNRMATSDSENLRTDVPKKRTENSTDAVMVERKEDKQREKQKSCKIPLKRKSREKLVNELNTEIQPSGEGMQESPKVMFPNVGKNMSSFDEGNMQVINEEERENKELPREGNKNYENRKLPDEGNMEIEKLPIKGNSKNHESPVKGTIEIEELQEVGKKKTVELIDGGKGVIKTFLGKKHSGKEEKQNDENVKMEKLPNSKKFTNKKLPYEGNRESMKLSDNRNSDEDALTGVRQIETGKLSYQRRKVKEKLPYDSKFETIQSVSNGDPQKQELSQGKENTEIDLVKNDGDKQKHDLLQGQENGEIDPIQNDGDERVTCNSMSLQKSSEMYGNTSVNRGREDIQKVDKEIKGNNFTDKVSPMECSVEYETVDDGKSGRHQMLPNLNETCSNTNKGKTCCVEGDTDCPKHLDMSDDELNFLVRHNFSIILEEINALELIDMMSEQHPEVKQLRPVIEELGFRRKRALRFLLELLCRREWLRSFWNAMSLEYEYCYGLLFSKEIPPLLHVPELKMCSRCSQEAFGEFVSKCSSVPEDLLIQMLQNDILLPAEILDLLSCSDSLERLQLFKIIISSRVVLWGKFIECILPISDEVSSKLKQIIDKMDFVPCSNCERAYNLTKYLCKHENDSLAKENKAFSLKVNDFSSKDATSRIAVFTLNIDKGKEAIVETILRKKDIINSQISDYGKIKGAWCGSVVVVLQLDNEKSQASLLKIISKIFEDEDIRQHLNETKIFVEVSVLDDAQEQLAKKFSIMTNFNRLVNEVEVKSFMRSFSDSGIIAEKDFENKFLMKSQFRKQSASLFLHFILDSNSEILNTFLRVIDEDKTYECMSNLTEKILQKVQTNLLSIRDDQQEGNNQNITSCNLQNENEEMVEDLQKFTQTDKFMNYVNEICDKSKLSCQDEIETQDVINLDLKSKKEQTVKDVKSSCQKETDLVTDKDKKSQSSHDKPVQSHTLKSINKRDLVNMKSRSVGDIHRKNEHFLASPWYKFDHKLAPNSCSISLLKLKLKDIS